MAKFYTEVTDFNQNVVINIATTEEANFLDIFRVVSYGLQEILESYDEYVYQPKTETLPQIYYCRKGNKVDYLALAVDLIKNYMAEKLVDRSFKIMYLYSDFSKSELPDSSKTPIAIQVAPASHFQDKKARWMSLVNMSLTDPDNGTDVSGNDDKTNPGAGIIWGYDGTLGTINADLPGYVVNRNTITDEPKRLTDSVGFISNDHFDAYVDPVNDKYHYNSGALGGKGNYPAVNPFMPDDSLNVNNRLYAFAQENGYTLTNLMIAAQTVAWQNVQTIDNEYKQGNYPAACVCRRFEPFDGDGYLPSICELQYLAVNINSINDKLLALDISVGVGIGDLANPLGTRLWSSSEYSSDGSWYLFTASCNVINNVRSGSDVNSRVRAFLAY